MMMLLAALLGLISGACCLAAHRERPVRRWVPHVVMAAAMVAMALPGAAGPLGPLGWSLILAATAAWTAARADDPLAVRLPAAYDLLAMAGLLFIHWRAALSADGAMGHDHAHGHDMAQSAASGLTPAAVAVVTLWAVARFGLPHRARDRRPLARFGGLAMAGVMGLMLL